MTDDSELGMCLLTALVHGNLIPDGEDYVLPTKVIAKYYGQWIDSGPFDIGMATNGALSALAN